MKRGRRWSSTAHSGGCTGVVGREARLAAHTFCSRLRPLQGGLNTRVTLQAARLKPEGMTLPSLASSKPLAALLGRRLADPADWIRSAVQRLPEIEACLLAEPPPEAGVAPHLGALHKWRHDLLSSQVQSHWLMQPELDAEKALQAFGLPASVVAAALQQLPSPTCSPAQLRAAVQHPGVTRLLLQHLRKAAGSSGAALGCWHPAVFKAVVREAARLGDLTLLDDFAACIQAVSLRAGQQMAENSIFVHKPPPNHQQQQQQQQQQPQQQEEMQRRLEQLQEMQRELEQSYCVQYRRDLAHAALDSAAAAGHLGMLWRAAAPGSHAASPAAQMLQLDADKVAGAAARHGQLAMLQQLLQDAAQPLDASRLLCAAIAGNQLPAFQLVLSKCGMPADVGPALEAAVRYLQPAVVRRLVDRGGLPADVGRLVGEAIRTGQPTAAGYLLQHGSLPATANVHLLLGDAIERGQAAVAQLLLQHGSLPADTGPLLQAAMDSRMPDVALGLLARGSLPADARPLLAAAIANDQPAVVQQVLVRSSLVPTAAELIAAIQVPSPACVRLLLDAAGGPVEVPPPAGVLDVTSAAQSQAAYTCPVLVVLQQRLRTDRRVASAGKLLRIMEALQAAGYRPTVYENVHVRRIGQPGQLVPRFDPIVEDPGLHLQGANKFLWLAAQRPDWSPETHHRFHPRFKRAVRALLLVLHHTRQDRVSGSGLAQRLPTLPPDLLFRVLGQAAYPLSAWAPGVQE